MKFSRLLALAACLFLAACSCTPDAAPVRWSNSLGMSFVAVPVSVGGKPSHQVWMAVTETRERDVSLMRAQIGRKARRSLPSSAAAHVSWRDAQRFCSWLTELERAKGVLSDRQRYRLPTDHEWSCAVGIGHLESPRVGPEAKSNRVAGFPWGQSWPPPFGAGNYAGEEAKLKRDQGHIVGFRDSQALGAGRAGLSVPNALGLQDLGGNLWEWCEDSFRGGTDWHVLRGGAWTSWRPETLASSHRTHDPADYRSDSVGFRVVLEGR